MAKKVSARRFYIDGPVNVMRKWLLLYFYLTRNSTARSLWRWYFIQICVLL